MHRAGPQNTDWDVGVEVSSNDPEIVVRPENGVQFSELWFAEMV
jgi:hypothetical protein